MEEKLVSEVQCDIRWHTGNMGVLFVNSYSTLMWREWSQNLELDFICRIWYSVWYHDSLICILNRHLALDLGSWSHAPDGGVREFDDAAHLWVTPLRVRYYDTKKRWVGSQDLYFWELGWGEMVDGFDSVQHRSINTRCDTRLKITKKSKNHWWGRDRKLHWRPRERWGKTWHD